MDIVNGLRLGLFSLLMSGCSDENLQLAVPDRPTPINFRPLLCPEQGGTTSLEHPSQTVLKDQNNYLHHIEISALYFSGSEPEVDFSAEMVLAVNGGQRYSGGYKVEITEVLEVEQRIEVYFDSVTPTSGCTTNDALTSPFCMVAIPLSEKPVTFVINAYESCN